MRLRKDVRQELAEGRAVRPRPLAREIGRAVHALCPDQEKGGQGDRGWPKQVDPARGRAPASRHGPGRRLTWPAPSSPPDRLQKKLTPANAPSSAGDVPAKGLPSSASAAVRLAMNGVPSRLGKPPGPSRIAPLSWREQTPKRRRPANSRGAPTAELRCVGTSK